jgi:hypothetical protein
VKSNQLAIGFVIVAVVCIVIAALYAVGILQFLASGSGVHIKHAILFGVLAVASLIAANFTRVKTA